MATPMILIGTSGYSFPDWVGPFYPLGTDRGKMLDHYVQHFPTVEVNATYYRIPPPSTLHAMERKTPPGFEFVVKAHHDMTHKRSLDDEIYQAFARSVDPLLQAGKLSGVLAQFPYAFRRTRENEKFLGEMTQRLPEMHRGVGAASKTGATGWNAARSSGLRPALRDGHSRCLGRHGGARHRRGRHRRADAAFFEPGRSVRLPLLRGRAQRMGRQDPRAFD